MPSADSQSPKGPSPSQDVVAIGSRFMLLDNATKAIEPLLVLWCASLYAGGPWGTFKVYESVILLLLRFAVAGLDRGMVWIHARRPDDAGFTRAFSRGLNFSILLAIALCGVGLLQATGILPEFGKWGRNLPVAPLLDSACYLISIPLQASALLCAQAFINKRALGYNVLVRNILPPILTYGPAAGLAFTAFKPHGLAVPYLLGSLASCLAGLWGFFRVYHPPRGAWSFSPRVPSDLLRFSLPLATTDVAMSFAYRIDILMLQRYGGSAAVEIYSVANLIANSLRGIRNSFDGLMLSAFSHASSTRQRQFNFGFASFAVLSLQIPLALIAVFFGHDLLAFYSAHYAPGGTILGLATAFNLAITLGAFSGFYITGLGKTWVIPFAQATFFITSLSLNILWVPHLGGKGAALATGCAHLLSGGLCFLAVWRLEKRFPFSLKFAWPLLVGLFAFTPVLAMRWLSPTSLLGAIILFGVGAIPYAWLISNKWKGYSQETSHA